MFEKIDKQSEIVNKKPEKDIYQKESKQLLQKKKVPQKPVAEKEVSKMQIE